MSTKRQDIEDLAEILAELNMDVHYYDERLRDSDFTIKKMEAVETLTGIFERARSAEDASCYLKALLDEPIFTLRSNDRVAPATVRRWAGHASAAGMDTAPGSHGRAKFDEAMDCAVEMERWQREHPKLTKVPD